MRINRLKLGYAIFAPTFICLCIFIIFSDSSYTYKMKKTLLIFSFCIFMLSSMVIYLLSIIVSLRRELVKLHKKLNKKETSPLIKNT